MRELLVVLGLTLSLTGLVLSALALVSARRRRQGCGHTRYLGSAGVVCFTCHREQHRLAAHVAGTTSRSGGPRA